MNPNPAERQSICRSEQSSPEYLGLFGGGIIKLRKKHGREHCNFR